MSAFKPPVPSSNQTRRAFVLEAILFGLIICLTCVARVSATGTGPSNSPSATVVATNLAEAVPRASETDTKSSLSNAPAKDSTAAAAPAINGETNSSDTAPEPGMLATPSVALPLPVDHLREFQLQLELARTGRREKNYKMASEMLVTLLETNAPPELKRPALFELALINQDENQPVKAQQIFSQYVQTYPEDPTVPEVLLRQGLLYRQMGVNTLAISKFYAVMSTALKLKLEDIDYYKRLVLQAQAEIADTFYLEGRYDEASDFFTRLLKSGPSDLNKSETQFKLIRSLYCLTNNTGDHRQRPTFSGTLHELAGTPGSAFSAGFGA